MGVVLGVCSGLGVEFFSDVGDVFSHGGDDSVGELVEVFVD